MGKTIAYYTCHANLYEACQCDDLYNICTSVDDPLPYPFFHCIYNPVVPDKAPVSSSGVPS